MTDYRQCSRPGCARPAVATLVYSYARQVATIGPLRLDDDPHSWDLCQNHVRRTTVPQGWDLVTEPGVDPTAGHGAGDGQQDGPRDEEDDLSEDDLLALVEATDPAANPRPSADPDPGPRVVRRSEVDAPSGRHPSLGNLPRRTPRRHLRAVRGDG
ncbi:DUF3499 family protein [Corynebacterium bovis]|uniref:DUF3499 domain-containing protein n=1 Tax=Corynebacterium bovis DSM 20582 = CIP 54.80 TaxID=927655 RepID=A0A8I0CKL2_9CORY|nr:DUF3499 family protein [Corynebacterium bovis]MBB3115662.1 hypothetical protein [Corynebacterium bovis DSM 20582 = CIP 54.80]QQC47359.1 DUF3499 family protein [Corynebacterium bovis]RRO78997.1 DUF3499 domain-containing protein [Corynebacterium bovis]RRO81388.1 DUF3499 domain-containing protein [Corynebacterium bovis]RRO83618.1 DUF3499 domain-containing protein [Corynebacterium bovis]